jgi:translation initiation factor 1
MLNWKEQLNLLKPELPEGEKEPAKPDKTAGKIQKEPLQIEFDRRNGKPATLVCNFAGSDEALKELAAMLKKKCSAGGSVRDGEILIQGDFCEKIACLLVKLGYKVKTVK